MILFIRSLFRLLALTTAMLIVFTGCEEDPAQPDPGPPASPILFVANQTSGGGSLTMVDLGTGAVSNVDNVPLGDVPNDIILKDDLLYVINSGSHNLNTVRIASRSTIILEDTVWVGGRTSQRNPLHGALYNNEKIFVTNYADGTMSVYDLNRNSSITYEDLGGSLADIMVIGAYLYICDTGWDAEAEVFNPGQVLALNAADASIVKTISVATNPRFMTRDADGRLHVCCSGEPGEDDGQIRVIDANTNEMIQVIPLGGEPGDLVINSENIGYVTAGGDDDPGLVFRYDARTGELLNGPDNPIEVSRGARRVVLGSDDEVFVSCNLAGRVDKIVGSTRVDSYIVGSNPGPMVIY